MTRCQQIERVLAAYSDGDLGGYVRQEVAEHIAHCEGCRSRLEGYKQSLTMVTAGLKETVPAARHSLSVTVPAPRTGPRVAWALAAAGLILAAGWLFTGDTPEEEAPVDVATHEAVAPDPETEALRARIAQLEADVAALRAAYERTKVASREPLVDERDVVAAITLAAGMRYERMPSGSVEAAERYRYVAKAYGNTPSGRTAIERLTAMGLDTNAPQGAKETQ